MTEEKKVIVHPARIPIKKKTIYLWIFVPLVALLVIVASLTSYNWTAYALRVSDVKETVVVIGGSSSETKCHKRAQRKLEEGVFISRFDQANSHFCGKYCFEIPLVENLKRAHVFCMIKRPSGP